MNSLVGKRIKALSEGVLRDLEIGKIYKFHRYIYDDPKRKLIYVLDGGKSKPIDNGEYEVIPDSFKQKLMRLL